MKKKPTVIQVSGGEKYHATVLKVLTRDEDGTPRTFEILRDDESTQVEDGMSFWIVYAPKGIRERRN